MKQRSGLRVNFYPQRFFCQVNNLDFSRATRPRHLPALCHSEPGAKPGEEPAVLAAVTKAGGSKLTVEAAP